MAFLTSTVVSTAATRRFGCEASVRDLGGRQESKYLSVRRDQEFKKHLHFQSELRGT